jgi:succinate dehydrogenase hydrophobic anchor subunit
VIQVGILDTVLQTAPRLQARAPGYGGSFIFQAVTAVSVLLVAVGIFYVLIKLGSFLDAMKEKTEAGSTKK